MAGENHGVKIGRLCYTQELAFDCKGRHKEKMRIKGRHRKK